MIVIIGGGPAGRIAAMRLAQAGREVRLVEQKQLGGQCLESRCMVMCALNDVARMLRTTGTLKARGIVDSVPNVSFSNLVKEMGTIQQTIGAAIAEETHAAGVEVCAGCEGRIDGDAVLIDGKKTDCNAAIAATGSRPAIPDIEGIDRPGVHTYRTILSLHDVPRRIAILGGGIVAAEYAHVFDAFGAKVTVISRSAFLKSVPEKLRVAAGKDLARVSVHEHASVRSIEGPGSVREIVVEVDGGTLEIGVDAVLIAAGLVPRSENISGPAKGTSGEIIVDDRMETSVPRIYACGDVTGPPYLTPVARREGAVAAENILGLDRRMDYRGIPQAMNLAKTYAFASLDDPSSFSLHAPAPAGPDSFWEVSASGTGAAEVSVNPETGRITGIAAAAPGASAYVSYLSYLMRKNTTVSEFEDFIEIHPSTDGISWLIRYAKSILENKQ